MCIGATLQDSEGKALVQLFVLKVARLPVETGQCTMFSQQLSTCRGSNVVTASCATDAKACKSDACGSMPARHVQGMHLAAPACRRFGGRMLPLLGRLSQLRFDLTRTNAGIECVRKGGLRSSHPSQVSAADRSRKTWLQDQA